MKKKKLKRRLKLGTYIRIWKSKRFRYKKRLIYKKIAQVVAVNEMVKLNKELMNTLLNSRVVKGEDFDFDKTFDRCYCVMNFLTEHRKILLQELFELDYKAYVAIYYEVEEYCRNFVITYDKEREIDYPIPTFLSKEKEGFEYEDINVITMYMDYYKKNLREMIRVVK